jgi:hypothetical protein
MARAPSVSELESRFAVYFSEMDRCRGGDAYWSLLHVVVALPDICAALQAGNGETTPNRYKDWCRLYCPPDVLTADDYWDMRNIVLHQGRTRTRRGRFYKFTKPSERGNVVHRWAAGDVIVLDVGELAAEMTASVRAWFVDLQTAARASCLVNVAHHLPSLVMVHDQELPGVGGVTFTFTNTCTGAFTIRTM